MGWETVVGSAVIALGFTLLIVGGLFATISNSESGFAAQFRKAGIVMLAIGALILLVETRSVF